MQKETSSSDPSIRPLLQMKQEGLSLWIKGISKVYSSGLITEDQVFTRMHYLMGTFVQIEASGKRKEQTIEAIEAAFSEMKRVERILSKYSEQSLTYRINRFASLFPVEVASELFKLIEESIRFSQITDGAFDITVHPLMELWGLSQDGGRVPSNQDIEQVLSKIGYTNIVLDPQHKTVFFKQHGMNIDFGAIGKGYAIDRAVAVLKRNNIKKALINAGGNIFCLADEHSRVGVKNPLRPDDIIAAIPLENKAISTSANYERCFMISGKSYGHLIDPKTGYPVDKTPPLKELGGSISPSLRLVEPRPVDRNVLSVSIISVSAKIADILSTAVFILGQHKGMELINGINDVEGLIIIKTGRRPKIYASSGLGPYLKG